jgi:hypothetical protein
VASVSRKTIQQFHRDVSDTDLNALMTLRRQQLPTGTLLMSRRAFGPTGNAVPTPVELIAALRHQVRSGQARTSEILIAIPRGRPSRVRGQDGGRLVGATRGSRFSIEFAPSDLLE